MFDSRVREEHLKEGVVRVYTRPQFFALAQCNACGCMFTGENDLTAQAYSDALVKLRDHRAKEHKSDDGEDG